MKLLNKQREEIMSQGNVDIHVVNRTGHNLYVAAHHAGCGGTPWRGGRPKCWTKDPLKNNETGIYVPDAWVTGFDGWLDIIIAAGTVALNVALIVGTDGAAAPIVAEEADVELSSLSNIELSEIEEAASATRLESVAAKLGMSVKMLRALGVTMSGVTSIAAGEAYNKLFGKDWGIYVGKSGDTDWIGAETDLYKCQYVIIEKNKGKEKYVIIVEKDFHKNKKTWVSNN